MIAFIALRREDRRPYCNGSWRVTYSVNSGSENVQKPLRDEPGQTHLPIELFHAKDLDAVKDGHNSAQAHSDEHERAERPPSRCAELGKQHDDGSCYSNACNLQVKIELVSYASFEKIAAMT
jgi:hypothetical protein